MICMEKGFLDCFLVTPVTETLFKDDGSDTDQMRYERMLRGKIAKKIVYPGSGVDFSNWRFYYSHDNDFVDFSTFYSMLTYVRFDAVSTIEAEADSERRFILWTYGAVTVFCNGKKVCEVDRPVYKPIIKKEFDLHLKAGRNEIYVVLQNLGVRDTRNLFALECLDTSGLSCTIPAVEHSVEFLKAKGFLDGIRMGEAELFFPSDSVAYRIGYDSNSPDFADEPTRISWKDWSEGSSFKVEDGHPYVLVKVSCGSQELVRRFEFCSMIHPEYSGCSGFEDNYRRMLKRIASAEGLSRGGKFGFYIQNILARKALGIVNPRDGEYFLTTLQQISDRYDCSDFLISGVIRYMKNYEVSDELKAKIKDVLLNYRYWMTMKGSDAMCFWSENHSLLFYSSAMLVGEMYPDDYFPLAGMTGRELHEFGRRLTEEWFDDLEEYGFEEFLSTVYMNVTFACLLNIVDYAEESISKRASATIDRMLRMLALHVFDGVIIAPMGRVYRGIINPSKQGAQALMNLVNPSVPVSFGEGWLSYFATSSYKIPSDVAGLMTTDANEQYSTGDALVRIVKNDAYILTSVQSPRTDGFKRWENITLHDDVSKYENTHIYTKSFNERFHGTTFFQPGVYGYQQHMWMTALDKDAVLFINHPGSSCDDSSMRPGYWYGNGVMPAIKQEENRLALIYDIGNDHPIRFVHAYIPACKFDEIVIEDGYCFARKGDGCLALWSSTNAVAYDDVVANAELRFYGVLNAFFLEVGRISDHGSFDAFMDAFKRKEISFDPDSLTVYADKKAFMTAVPGHDDTQYV